jgi:hypothetical protein
MQRLGGWVFLEFMMQHCQYIAVSGCVYHGMDANFTSDAVMRMLDSIDRYLCINVQGIGLWKMVHLHKM